MNEVEKILNRIGYDGYLVKDESYVVFGPRAIRGRVRPELLRTYLHVLRHDKRFIEDVWNFLHPEIGQPKTGFRSLRNVENAIDKRSVQQVINTETGEYYADVDRYNTQDLVNIVAHNLFEVIKWPWRKTV